MTFSVKMNLSTQPQTRPQARAYDLFPTRIWQAKLDPLAGHFAGWERHILDMRAQNPAPAGRTVRSGWNSEDFALLDDPVFAPLSAEIRAQIQDVMAQMQQAHMPYALQSWVNMHDRGGFNFAHAHEGCYLSGSFYLTVPQGSGSLVFRDPRPGALYGPFKGNGANAYTDVKLAPSAGLLVLFPNWLEHFVEPHGADDPRIAIAFNALPA